MTTVFDSQLSGKNITVSHSWHSPVLDPDELDGDSRWEAYEDEKIPSTVTLTRTNNRTTMFTFKSGAIIATNSTRIRYNLNDVISSEE